MIERDHIGFFGKMNSGKSTVMNLLTQQETSIVDSTPGTTADTKHMLQEIHGLGPVKFYDTAGVNERDRLGEKKRKKVFSDLKECDLVMLVIDPATKNFSTEQLLLDEARALDKQLMVVYNLFNPADSELIPQVEEALSLLRFYPKISINASQASNRGALLEFILAKYQSKRVELPLLPFLQPDCYYVLNIPMDEETPEGRFLRPQSMCVEYITRHRAFPVCYRMDLGAARSQDESTSQKEKERFLAFLDNFKEKPLVVITDSQAMDIAHNWVPADIELTTFSIMMIHYISKGRLDDFANGLQVLPHLESGDKVLIVEACNHSRIAEDIGTVQIPKYIKAHFPGVSVDFNFGREFQENDSLSQYKLIIHCGGCMIAPQKLQARIRDLDSVGVPYTNYGLFLAYMQGEKAVSKVMAPWRGL